MALNAKRKCGSERQTKDVMALIARMNDVMALNAK